MSKAITNRDMTDTTFRRVRPSVDVFENDVEYLVHVDLPGVQSDAVKLTLEQDSIQLEATRRAQLSDPVLYTRTFSLPDVVDREAVKAHLEHGLMALVLPKRASHQPRQISVTAN
jgi:HSP20 family molecular chaperone IbpA